ncbi:hypothetical protein LTR37_003709 [Vermiconidia calcicola]|uniref:Uncharacterized protein n=1 Tax=Vermiconidia calcicola TaxID=1690605 RepID=A0ACC3NPR9_9PEZI|nr:hypothetical protein LTR37_003709 [Vermiconidia calcicola]
MSSKFFTWTKGDRRNASEALKSNGIVPIPAECISIRGMDYARSEKYSSKSHRKPTPLVIEGTAVPNSRHSSRTNESVAFHDAAVQSATSLMAVMNDMLRSPPLSAHLLAQNHQSMLDPMHGRPRSRTAPSTPLVEAPTSELFELPGSVPLNNIDKKTACRQPGDGSVEHLSAKGPASATIAGSIIRPRSSPQETTTPFLGYPSAWTPRLSSRLRSSIDTNPLAKGHTLDDAPGGFFSAHSAENSLVNHSDTPLALSIRRPTYSVLPEPPTSSSLPDFPPVSRVSSSQAVTQARRDHNDPPLLGQADTESSLLDHISELRASHEAHLKSLKETHEKEMASQQAYIAFLEKQRRTTIRPQPVKSDECLPTTTTSCTNVSPSEQRSNTTSDVLLRSLESMVGDEQQYRGLGTPTTSQEFETLKCRVTQLKNIVRKANDNETALKNTIADLEGRLVAANNERLDVLEGFHEACAKVHTLSERKAELNGNHETTNGPITEHKFPDSASNGNPLWQQIQDLRHTVATKDAHIQRLEEVLSAGTNNATGPSPFQSAELSELRRELDSHEQLLATARSDCERYNSLLHAELRRQTRSAARNTQPIEAEIEAQARTVVMEKMIQLKAACEKSGSFQTDPATANTLGAQSAPSVSVLENELLLCTQMVIKHKLDAKNYRKDLRKAYAKIETLQAIALQRPPTPDRQSAGSGRSIPSPELPRTQFARPMPQHQHGTPGTVQSGLGISFFESEKTPTKSLASATAAALLSPRSGVSSAVSSPPPRPKTPLSAHKKLPKPPPSPALKAVARLPTTPPPSNTKLQRNETLRSLSESIISSYAKRDTPPDRNPGTTPPATRSSAPLQSHNWSRAER